MKKWPSGKVSVTVSKFKNAYSPHITGYFYLQIYAVFSMTNVNAALTQFYGLCKHGKVTFAGKVCPVIFRFYRSRNAPTTSIRRL